MGPSRRIQAVQSPIIPIVAGWIRETSGVISLGQGVVYYGPPPQARERLEAFWAKGDNHKYKAVEGVPELVEGLAAKLRLENGVDLAGRRVVVSAGGNMAFLNVVLAVGDVGDEFILLRPAYFNHEMAVGMAGCRGVMVKTDGEYQPVLSRIAAAVTERTKGVVTVSPNNPTGAVYSEEVLRVINGMCRERGIYHIHDEAYEYFTYGGVGHFSPCSVPESAGYTVGLYSMSKSYGMASWRVGYAAVPEGLFESIRKIQDTNVICPPVISQFAALGALEAGRGYCMEKRKEIEVMRGMLREELEGVRGCRVPRAEGAFYYLVKVETGMTGMRFAERLVREHGVAVIPGEAFGMTGGGGGCYLRVGYGVLTRDLAAEGFGRLAKGIAALCSGGSR